MKGKKLLFYSFISLAFFGILYKMEYATDTYAVFNFNKEAAYMQYAMSGRFITGFIIKALKMINMPENIMYILSYSLAIICVILGQLNLYKIIEKDVKNIWLRYIIPTLIILNPFSIEFFLYFEKGIMWFGVLMCIFALRRLISSFETRKKKNILLSMIYMFLANCSYQGVVGLFASISLIYVIKDSKNAKDFVYNNYILILIYSIPALVDMLLIKILFKINRITGIIVFKESLYKILKSTYKMFISMYELLPKYSFILLILFTFTVFCCKIWKEKKYLHILNFLYIFWGTTFFAIVPQIIQPTNSIWFVPRTTYSFASMYGILVLYLALNYNIEKKIKFAILIISIGLLLFQLQKFVKIEKDRFIVNQNDEIITKSIIEQIDDYERKTGNRITQACIYQDKKPNYTYDNILAIGDINIKCYYADWSSLEILKYYLKRDMKLSEKNELLDGDFKKQNWDEFNENQIVFKENTINICNY